MHDSKNENATNILDTNGHGHHNHSKILVFKFGIVSASNVKEYILKYIMFLCSLNL